MADKKIKRQVTLKPTTVAYAYLNKPDTGHKFSNGKFKATLVYDDLADLDHVEAAVREIAAEEWGGRVNIDEVKRPFRTPDEQTKEAFEGKTTLNMTSKYKPQAFDAKRKPLPEKVSIFGGDKVAAIVTLMPYESTEKVREGSKVVTLTVYGVSAQIGAVQLVEKRAGGGVSADMFGEYDDGYDASGFQDYGSGDGDEGGEPSFEGGETGDF